MYRVWSYHGHVNTTYAAPTLEMLDAVRTAPSLLAAIELLDSLVDSVRDEGEAAMSSLRDAIDDDTDQVTAIAAVHAAAAGGAAMASALVVPLLTSPVPFLREHATWALRRCSPLPGCRLQLQPAPALVRGAFTRPLVDPLPRPLGRPTSPNPVPQNFLHGRPR